MADRAYELHGERIFECAAEGTQLCREHDAVELISAASEHRARFVVIAGAMLQKFVTYQFRFAIVGEISEHLKENTALKDFVRECNRGTQFWFLANHDQLEKRLDPRLREA